MVEREFLPTRVSQRVGQLVLRQVLQKWRMHIEQAIRLRQSHSEGRERLRCRPADMQFISAMSCSVSLIQHRVVLHHHQAVQVR